MNRLATLAFIALASCAAPETTRRADMDFVLPPMKTFATPTPSRPTTSNSQIARDFLDLTFQLENGTEMPAFTRFEGPITVAITGASPPNLRPDLARLLARLRREARIDIDLTRNTDTASIIIEPVRRAQIQSVAPAAACFVRPNVSGWDDYRAKRNDPSTFWNRLTARTRMAVFLPTDVSPQEMRDCLHEEIAQALGPVNDIYRLNQSVFNDDNFHTVLSGFDMLILRTYYDPALASGMSEAEVTSRLPAILARLNPSGGRGGVAAPERENTAWRKAIDRATRPDLSRARRQSAATEAVALAQDFGSADPRLAFSQYVFGRLTLGTRPDEALKAFLAAGRIYQNRSDTAIQEAHIAMQLAAFQLSAGRADVALRLVNDNIPTVTRSEHAALLSLFLLVKAEALELLARPDEAAPVQRDALAWARYGFGDDDEIRARADEIRAISPRTRQDAAS